MGMGTVVRNRPAREVRVRRAALYAWLDELGVLII
jgi:hypothetical protein